MTDPIKGHLEVSKYYTILPVPRGLRSVPTTLVVPLDDKQQIIPVPTGLLQSSNTSGTPSYDMIQIGNCIPIHHLPLVCSNNCSAISPCWPWNATWEKYLVSSWLVVEMTAPADRRWAWAPPEVVSWYASYPITIPPFCLCNIEPGLKKIKLRI